MSFESAARQSVTSNFNKTVDANMFLAISDNQLGAANMTNYAHSIQKDYMAQLEESY